MTIVGAWAEVNIAQFLVGVRAEVYIALKRGEVNSTTASAQQSRRVTTCTTGKAVSVEDFDGTDDGESTTILQASGEDCCDSAEVNFCNL